MKKPAPTRLLPALLPLVLLLWIAGDATAAGVYEAAWEGGHLTATADAGLTEATIDDVSVSFDECGTNPKETSCAWEALATLHSSPASRCNPATPEDQVVWESGLQPENGTVVDGPVSFPLEGCRGQTLVFEIASERTFDEGPVAWSRSGSLWPLFTFGYHPFEEAERRIITESPPATPAPPPMPTTLAVAADCRSLTIGNVSYLFSFRRLGCRKAADLASMRHLSGRAPSGYHCKNGGADGGVLCWRIGHPKKYLEWRLPGTRPTPRPRS